MQSAAVVVGSAESTAVNSGVIALLFIGWMGFGLIGVLLGRNKALSKSGAFIAGLFGVFGWLFILASPNRPEGQPVEAHRDHELEHV